MPFNRELPRPLTSETALPGRAGPITTAMRHAVNGRALKGPYPSGAATAIFGLGCFWGAERRFFALGDGIWITAVGYCGGLTPNPTYEEVCSERTGHAETVLVAFDPSILPFADLLRCFWEGHDPTQGLRQGNDIGPQYRSAIYCRDTEQERLALVSCESYARALQVRGFPAITTEIAIAGPFYFAEAYHQQYLAKNPHGYCGLGGTGIVCPPGDHW